MRRNWRLFSPLQWDVPDWSMGFDPGRATADADIIQPVIIKIIQRASLPCNRHCASKRVPETPPVIGEGDRQTLHVAVR